jgi:hypothetical protein
MRSAVQVLVVDLLAPPRATSVASVNGIALHVVSPIVEVAVLVVLLALSARWGSRMAISETIRLIYGKMSPFGGVVLYRQTVGFCPPL